MTKFEEISAKADSLVSILMMDIMEACDNNPYSPNGSFIAAQAIANIYGWFSSGVGVAVGPELTTLFKSYCQNKEESYNVRNERVLKEFKNGK